MRDSAFDKAFVDSYFRHRPDIARWWQPERGLFRVHYDRELRAIGTLLEQAPHGLALDYGTGRGRVAKLLAARGHRVLALDVNPFILREAAEGSAGLSVQYGIATSDALLGREWAAVVTLIEVMDHLPEPEQVLGDLVRALLPGGLLILSFVSAESLYGRLAHAARRRTSDPALRVARAYSLDEIEGLVGRLGLTVEAGLGVGLLSLPVRPGLGLIGLPFAALIHLEGALRPWVERRRLVRRSTTVVLSVRKPLA